MVANMSAATVSVNADPVLDRYLDLPLTNRDAAHGPGGISPALPADRATLMRLLTRARSEHIDPHRYAALLQQYWLATATQRAGIDLAAWNPRVDVFANRADMIKSYRLHENLQLEHRELQWAGMGGQVGADFGGGLEDAQAGVDLYAGIPGLSGAVNTLVSTVRRVAGPQALNQLPAGLRAIADGAAHLDGADAQYLVSMVMVMQKAIFTDLMPMHIAYVTGGVPAVAEFGAAGLVGPDIVDAWRDIASGDARRIGAGNQVLLRREQQWAVGAQWDEVRDYKNGAGAAFTYMTTAVGQPSVADVPPMRAVNPVHIRFTAPDGHPMILTLPLPNWDWSVFPDRWNYVTTELLPKYQNQVKYNWPALEATMRTPYEVQWETHSPLLNFPAILLSAVQQLSISPA